MKINYFSKPLVGLDIRADHILFVELTPKRHHFLLTRFAKHTLEGNAPGNKITHWEGFKQTLAHLVKAYGLQDRATAVALPAALVTIQQLQMPASTEQTAISAAVLQQLERQFPTMTDTLAIDYFCLPTLNKKEITVPFIATRRDYLEQLIACINDAGLRVKLVDVDLYAILRTIILSVSSAEHAPATKIILLMDKQTTSFAICQQQTIIFTQTMDIDMLANGCQQLVSYLHIATANLMLTPPFAFYLCMDGAYRAALITAIHAAKLGRVIELHWPDLIQMDASQQIDFDAMQYWIASGAAMQEVPVW